MTQLNKAVSRHAPACRLFCVPLGEQDTGSSKNRALERVGRSTKSTRRRSTPMLSETQSKSANFLRILLTLRALRQRGTITEAEYRRAKKYYLHLTGADIILAD